MIVIFAVLVSSCVIVSHALVCPSSLLCQRPVPTGSCVVSHTKTYSSKFQKLRPANLSQSLDASEERRRRVLYPSATCIDPPFGGAALASRTKSKQRRLSSSALFFATPDNSATPSSDPEQKASIPRRAFANTFGRLWHALVYISRNLFVKPFRSIKNVFAKGNSVDKDMDQNKKESVTDVGNPFASNEWKNANVNGETMLVSQPNELNVSTIVQSTASGSNVQRMNNVTTNSALLSSADSTKVTSDNLKDSVLVSERPVIVSESPIIVAKNPVIVSKNPIIVSAIQELASNFVAAAESVAARAESMVGSVVDSFPIKLGPKGQRWAVAASGVDLTGKWKIIVTDEFKKEYDEYLRSLGQAAIVRSVACSIVDRTREETVQKQNGRELYIKGTNIRGTWERTLIASGSDRDAEYDDTNETPVRVSVLTADSERVEAEAWWEENGKVHRSWMRGGKKYGGGDFESKRYLDKSGSVYVCESVFHPNDETRPKSYITWRFSREANTPRR